MSLDPSDGVGFDREEALAFFRSYFSDDLECSEDIAVCVLALDPDRDKNTKGSNTKGMVLASSVAELVDACEHMEAKGDVYFSVCGLDPATIREGERGKDPSVSTVYGLWCDIDMADPGKKTRKIYPPTLEDARTYIECTPAQPSIVVLSGGGFHVYWMFDEPVTVSTEAEREEMTLLSRGWQRMIQRTAHADGYDVDSTFDLPRIMRAPGSTHKRLCRPVEVESDQSERLRYPPSDLRDMIPKDVWETAAAAPRAIQVDHSSVEEGDGYRVSAKIRGAQKETFHLSRVDRVPTAVSLMMQMDPEFERVWLRNRPSMKDQSQSSYDLSIATRLAALDVNIQDIVDSCIFHRLHGNPDDEKWRRGRYYSTLLVKAFEPIVSKRKEETRGRELEQLNEIVEEVSLGEREKQEARPQVMDLLRKFFPAIDHIDVAYNPGDPPLWTIRTKDSSFTLRGGAADILNFNSFRAAFAQVTRLVIPPQTNKSWSPIAAGIIVMAKEELLGQSDSTLNDIRDWVAGYLEHTTPAKTSELGLSEGVPYQDDLGVVWSTAATLTAHVRHVIMNGESRVTRKQVASYLRAAGATYSTKGYEDDSGARKSRTVYPISRVLENVPEIPTDE